MSVNEPTPQAIPADPPTAATMPAPPSAQSPPPQSPPSPSAGAAPPSAAPLSPPPAARPPQAIADPRSELLRLHERLLGDPDPHVMRRYLVLRRQLS